MDTRRQSGLWDQNSEGYYERKAPAGPFQYYQPPVPAASRRSFSERAADLDSPVSDVTADPLKNATQNGLVRSTSARKTDLQPKIITAQPRAIQPESPRSFVSDDSIPANLRNKTWSPEPTSPIEPAIAPSKAGPPVRHPSNASEAIRRSSLPERSPLQNLEAKLGDISKEEKRARMQEAERKAQETSGGQLARSATLRSERPRVVSDGSRRANDSVRRDERRNVSDGGAGAGEENGPKKFHRASDALRNSVRSGAEVEAPQSPSGSLAHTQSQKYRHRARDAGFAGAAAAMAGAGVATADSAAARGKAAHERRKSQLGQASPTVGSDSIRNKSGNVQKPTSQAAVQRDAAQTDSPTIKKDTPIIRSDGDGKHALHESRMGTGTSGKDAPPLQSDPLPRDAVHTANDVPVPYRIPPQTAAARQAKERVTFAPDVAVNEKPHHRGLFGHHIDARGYQSNVKPLEEWRSADIARLSAADLDLDDGATTAGAHRGSTWWESPAAKTSAQAGQAYEERAVSFDPPLFLKCGPLLRFTGIHKTSAAHTWRGSILIVTEDEHSDLTRTPSLRLFAQRSSLHKRQPTRQEDDAPENESHAAVVEDDAVTGLLKISRTGRPIYVRSLRDIEHGVDLSRVENNRGLFAASKPTISSRIHARDGEKIGVYRDIKAHRLHVEHGCTFWRFNLEIELGAQQNRMAYRINNGPAIAFWIPARGQTMNIMFHSCNGFSLTVDSSQFCGPDPLWRDVLNRHQSKPFHVMIGGGDQIYNDAAIRDTTHFKEWLQIKNPEHKHHADFTLEMQEELESFFFNRYAMWFSQGFFGMANSQIPMVNIYDDHDIIDGFGSYPHHFMSSPVFTGLGAVAFKYYMLFQQQSVPAETTKEEPSWLLGASPGPYINELNRSIFVWLGDAVALLALDCRTERMRDEIMSQESYDIIFDRCRAEIVKGHTRHLIVLLGVPIAYPRLNFLENILTSRLMDPIKAIGRTGMLGGFVNKFDGGVEILDDLDDHWTAKHHKKERNWFIQELQELAAERSVRVTILGGDVHLGAVGQFYSNKNLGVPKDKDHRYMPNVISSAIVNTPPPPMMADVLNKRNKVHHLDHETDEDMIPMFDHDVDFSKRNNKRLLPRRNFAIITEYTPGTTPPATPTRQQSFSSLAGDPEQPGTRRSLSLTRGPSRLIRRLSLRGRNPPLSMAGAQPRRPFSFHEDGGSREFERADSSTNAPRDGRPSFHRRPTNLSVKEARKAAAKGGPLDEDGETPLPGHINLEHGLDISLCMEVDQHDPSGHTIPYRLLVPALWYEGAGDRNTSTLPQHKESIFKRFGSLRKQRQPDVGQQYDREHHDQEYNDYRTDSPKLGAARPVDEYAHNDVYQQQGNTQTNAQHAHNAAKDDGLRSDYHRKSASQRSDYQRGLELGSPPLGKSERPIADRDHEGYFDDRMTEDSFADSEPLSHEYEDAEGVHDHHPEHLDDRRASKPERFFGITDGNEQSAPVARTGSLLRKRNQGGAGRTPKWRQIFQRGGAE